MKKWVGLILVCSVCASQTMGADETLDWGIGSAWRSASIPYNPDRDDDRLNSYVLLLYLDTPWLYLDGTAGGLKLYSDDAWEFSAYAGMHFVDMPRHDDHNFSDDTADLGLRLRYDSVSWQNDLRLLSDPAWRFHALWQVRRSWHSDRFDLTPFAELHYKSTAYNSYYYGLDRLEIGDDVGAAAGVEARWFLTDSFALLGDAKATYLGYETARAESVDAPVQNEFYLGAAIFESTHGKSRNSFPDKGYFRLAFGEATPSSFSEILTGQGSRDLNRLYMMSLFYGYPLSSTLFGASIASYATIGFVHHFQNALQSAAQEYIVGFKFYYRPDSWWLRFGFGTGISYITAPTYIERHINEKDGYDHTSHLMHYLDFSFDFSLEHLFGSGWRPYWLGYGLHHRSGVFESAHQYGQIKGGSNYNTIYLLWDFN